MIGKHSEESIKIKQLEETIRLRNQEIKDIKNSVADILLRIKILNESNSYGDPSIKKRKISELCTDTRYELLIDEIEFGMFTWVNPVAENAYLPIPVTLSGIVREVKLLHL